MTQRKRKLFNVRLNDIETRYLEDASDELGLNYSDTVRTLLRNFIRRKALVQYDIKTRY
jgi:antitoxin component of RelBE/YafQ-DinJ toxin-antitoxin module